RAGHRGPRGSVAREDVALRCATGGGALAAGRAAGPCAPAPLPRRPRDPGSPGDPRAGTIHRGPGRRLTMRLGFVVNDVATEEPQYTTTRLALAPTRRGHETWL